MFKVFDLLLLCIFASCCIVQTDARNENGKTPYSAEGRSFPEREWSPSNLTRSFDMLPKTCSYGGATFECAVGVACYFRGMKPVDLCDGGPVWACCVPRESIPPGKPRGDSPLAKAECGKTYVYSARIVGGESAGYGEYPWQVALVRQRLFTEFVYCGGALISRKYVVTAAHCVWGMPMALTQVRVGVYDFHTDSDTYTYDIAKRIIHPGYDSKDFSNDIALLQLAAPVEFKRHIVPICLPQSGARFDGEPATVSGWGTLKDGSKARHPFLQRVAVKVIDNDKCNAWFNDVDNKTIISDTMICAGVEEGGKDACQGDSGGPLIHYHDHRAQLIGIVSWGFQCGMYKSPGVYTSVSDYVDWIRKNVDDL